MPLFFTTDLTLNGQRSKACLGSVATSRLNDCTAFENWQNWKQFSIPILPDFRKNFTVFKVSRFRPFVLKRATCRRRWVWGADGMILRGENPLPRFPPQTSHGLPWNRTGACTIKDRLLTACKYYTGSINMQFLPHRAHRASIRACCERK